MIVDRFIDGCRLAKVATLVIHIDGFTSIHMNDDDDDSDIGDNDDDDNGSIDDDDDDDNVSIDDDDDDDDNGSIDDDDDDDDSSDMIGNEAYLKLDFSNCPCPLLR